MSDNQRAPSAETAVDRDDDRGRGRGLGSRVDPSPPVLAFGSQNVTALLVELRRRESLAVWGADQDLASNPPGAPVPATDCKEQP